MEREVMDLETDRDRSSKNARGDWGNDRRNLLDNIFTIDESG
jgi:hypothetical protein